MRPISAWPKILEATLTQLTGTVRPCNKDRPVRQRNEFVWAIYYKITGITYAFNRPQRMGCILN